MAKFDLIREIKEIKNQLSYSKRCGFFFGAGTSCALGVPNIEILTQKVKETLTAELQTVFSKLKEDLSTTHVDKKINIEDILNHIRQLRSITGERSDKDYLGVNGQQAKQLDTDICKAIYNIISEKEASADLTKTKLFFAWLNMQNQLSSTELFTSNYDLILEKSLEEIKTPYFDGFVGSYEPFFLQESIEHFSNQSDLTHNWLRLWKVHGSLNWFWKTHKDGSQSVIRRGKTASIDGLEDELVIYPSREKYITSQKQPFVAYFDRLRNVLQSGELLFIISGYSFADQHINEVFFNSLRQNNRLSILVFFFHDEEVEHLHAMSSSYLNLTAMGPNKCIIDGTLGEWTYDEECKEKNTDFWDTAKSQLKLGDYNNLVDFLITNSGKKENIEDIIR